MNTFDTPGVHFVASTSLGTNPGDILDQLKIPGCVDLGRDTYDDGYHTGQFQLFDACDGTQSGVVNVVGYPSDLAYAFVLQVQVVQQRDVDALARMISSLRIDRSRVR